jgi:O-antigen/teichoic acid export membrane protein
MSVQTEPQTREEKIPSATGPDSSLAVSIGKNTVFGVIARVAQVLTRLVTVPVVIAHLGLGGYGIWAIIMTAAAYMRFGSIGIKSAFQKYVAEATGTGDYESANKLLSTGTGAMLALSVAGLIPISLFSRSIAIAAGVPPEFLKSAAGAISMLALIMVLSNVGAAFEAIVMGGHRIDLARKFTTIFTVAEAVAIVILLHFGFGLFAMAAVMGLSEIGFLACCFVASRRVVPQVKLKMKYLSRSVLHELLRYAGSYQLVNIMEVVYGAIIPVAVLRVFGAESAGVYALATRLTSSAQMLPDAFLLPILSGGAKIYSSGAVADMQRLLKKSFKATLALTLLPLAFISIFGPTIIYAWTGEVNPSFPLGLLLVSVAGFFYSFSILGLVLYRVSGKALLDNIRQVLRILILFTIAIFATKLGFYGVLAGLAAAEFIGMVFMLVALAKTFHGFHLESLLPDTLRLGAASAIILAAGALAMYVPLPELAGPRLMATVKLGLICLACALVAWPALVLTKFVTTAEGKALFKVFRPRESEPGEAVVSGIEREA